MKTTLLFLLGACLSLSCFAKHFYFIDILNQQGNVYHDTIYLTPGDSVVLQAHSEDDDGNIGYPSRIWLLDGNIINQVAVNGIAVYVPGVVTYGGTSDRITILPGTGTGIQDREESIKVTAYPNPVTNQLNISLNENSGKINYRIIDLSGKEIDSGSRTGDAVEILEIPVAFLPSGKYFIQLFTGSSKKVVEFVKE